MAKREMTLMELQDVLGQRIRTILRTDLTPEQRQIENEQSALVMGLGKQMINNADIAMRFETLMAKNKNLVSSRMEGLLGE